jgi:hypothetical protein
MRSLYENSLTFIKSTTYFCAVSGSFSYNQSKFKALLVEMGPDMDLYYLDYLIYLVNFRQYKNTMLNQHW